MLSTGTIKQVSVALSNVATWHILPRYGIEFSRYVVILYALCIYTNQRVINVYQREDRTVISLAFCLGNHSANCVWIVIKVNYCQLLHIYLSDCKLLDKIRTKNHVKLTGFPADAVVVACC